MSTKLRIHRNTSAGCSLCSMYAKFGYSDSAKRAFYQIEHPGLVS